MKVMPVNNFYTNQYKNSNTQNNKNILNPYITNSVTFTHNKGIKNLSKTFHSEIKIFFSDVDGTLIGLNSFLPETAKKGLDLLEKNNIPIVFVTGKSLIVLKNALKGVDIPLSYCILQNGACIIDKNGNKLYEDIMPKEKVSKIIDAYKTYKQQYPKEEIYLYFTIDGIRYTKKGNNIIQNEDIHYVENFDDILSFDKMPTKALFRKKSSKGFEEMYNIRDFLTNTLDMEETNVLVTSHKSCEVVNKTASKGAAIEFLTKHLGIDISNAAVIGDAENDISMFQTVSEKGGLSIAMGNGSQQAKDSAEFITSHINNDGYYTAIKNIISNNEHLNVIKATTKSLSLKLSKFMDFYKKIINLKNK